MASAAAVTIVALSTEPANSVASPVISDTPTGSIGAIIQPALSATEIPLPIMSVPIQSTSTILKVPRVGYSFYKTAPDKAKRCAALALRSGVKHLDLATQYESNTEIGKVIRNYLKYGRTKLALDEKTELLDLMDAAYQCEYERTEYEGGKRGRARRREELFLSHKLSNEEQSTHPEKIREAVHHAMDQLGVDYLDMVSIHSPLTNSETRLGTYQALLDLQQGGKKSKSSSIVRSVGVCNYGLGPLKEIAAAGLPLPAVNQLELSPFNTHRDVVNWCLENGVAVSCSAWSKLSGTNGPAEQWDILSQIASKKGVTKAQVMVEWSLQKGYICVPRSGSGSKIERVAIAENSYGGGQIIKNGKITTNICGSNEIRLTLEEMKILDGLDVNYKAGKLGRTDGWTDADITGPTWDPTDIV